MATTETTTETTTVGWGARLGSSIKGIVAGIVLFCAGFPVLYFNEDRSVTVAETLEEGLAKVHKDCPVDDIDTSLNGELVHVQGQVTTGDMLRDPEYGVSTVGFQLVRTVEMFQWVEHEEVREEIKLGGKKERRTEYTYSTQWCTDAVNSDGFHDKDKINPPARCELGRGKPQYARNARMGVRFLSEAQIRRLTGSEPLVTKYQRVGTTEFVDEKPGMSAPKIGDVRVKFEVVKSPKSITVVAAQKGENFTEYVSKKTKREIMYLVPGQRTADQVFGAAARSNTFWTWMLRLLGTLLMYGGVRLVLAPMEVLADVVPLVGKIVRFGNGLVALAVAVPCALTTIAIAWIACRPYVAYPLLALALATLVAVIVLRRKAQRKAAAEAPTAA